MLNMKKKLSMYYYKGVPVLVGAHTSPYRQFRRHGMKPFHALLTCLTMTGWRTLSSGDRRKNG
jgi:hypothetical protein